MGEAEGLGLNYRTGRQVYITVGDGSLIPVHLHHLPIQLGPTRFNATIGFSPRLGVGFNLLGRQDLFSHFDVTFSDTRRLISFKPVR